MDRVARAGTRGTPPRARPAALGALAAAAAAVAPLLSLLAGCGATTAAAIVLGLGAAGGGSSDDAPPQVEVAATLERDDLAGASGQPDASEVAIPYRLVDPTGQPVDVVASWRLAAEPETVARTPTEAAGSDGLVGLAAAAAPGTLHRFVWAASADLQSALGLDEADVVFTLAPRRQALAGAPRAVALRAGNRAPEVLLDPAPAALTRTAVTRGTVADSSADPVVVTLRVREAGDPAAPLAVPNLLTDGGPTIVLGSTTPARANVAWDTLAAFGVRDLACEVLLTATDRFGASTTATATVAIDNDEPPTAQLIAVGTATGIASVDGRVPIRFALFDDDADLDPAGPSGRPSARIEVSTDGGQSFRAVTLLPLRGEHGGELSVASTAALAARPFPEGAGGQGANVHTALWDARADGLAGGGPINALVRVTPVADGQDGQPDQSPVRLGQAVELFTETERIVYGVELPAAHLADLDQDGHLDLVVEVGPRGVTGSEVAIRRGQGDGRFGAAADELRLPIVGAVSIGDLSGDGIPDLLQSGDDTLFAGAFVVWLGDGQGGFAALDHENDGDPRFTSSVGFPGRATLADLDGDGRLDVLLGHVFVNGVDLRFGTSTPPFFELLAQPVLPLPLDGTVSGLVPRAGDVDGDGTLDVIATDRGGGLAVFRGLGGRAFDPEVRFDTASSEAIELADLDGDGRLDVVSFTRGQAGAITLALEVRRGAAAPALLDADAPLTLDDIGYEAGALADFDGDGREDLVLGGTIPSELRVRFGDGQGGFGRPFGTSLGLVASGVALGDVDGDGVLDVVAVTDADGGSITVRRGQQGGLSSEPPLTPAGGAALADFDEDGRLDLATAGFEAIVRAGDGLAGFRVAGAFALSPARALGLAAADLDGDGRADLALSAGEQGTPTSTVLVLRGDGGPSLVGAPGPGREAALGAGPLVLIDADLDGRLDALVLEGGRIAVLPGDPALDPPFAAGAAPIAIGALGVAPPGVGDADGDGAPETLALPGFASGPNVFGVFLATATTTAPALAQQGFVRVETLALRASFGDVDDDGHLDLLIGEVGDTGTTLANGAVLVHRGLGGGLVAPARAIPAGPVIDVGAADIDGDGATDLVAWQPVANEVTLLRRPAPRGLGPAGPGGAARRGDGRPVGLHFARTSAPVPELGNVVVGLTLADLSGDGVADVVLPGDPLQVLVSAVAARSEAAPELTALLDAGAGEARRAPAPPLAFALLDPRPAAGTLLRPASDAVLLAPEEAALAAPAALALTLRTSLTAAELAGGVLRVLREERGRVADSAAGLDPATGVRGYRRVVEVGRRDPAGTTFPSGLVVDAAAGTLTLPIDRLGRYQVVLETPTSTALLVRETFDAPVRAAAAERARPFAWSGSLAWETGAPADAARPAPVSAPGLFAVGLRQAYRPGLDARARSPFAETPRVPAGRRARLRGHLWHDLGAGDRVELALVARGAGGVLAREVVETFTGLSDPDPALAERVFEVDGALASAFDALVGAGAGGAEGAAVAIELRLVSDDDGVEGRGFFIDDLELAIEAP